MIDGYEITAPVSHFDLLLPAGDPWPSRYRGTVEGLIIDRMQTAPDTLPALVPGFGGVFPMEDLIYNSVGDINWPPANPPVQSGQFTLGAVYSVGYPPNQRRRFRLCNDVGNVGNHQGLSGDFTVWCPGVISGHAKQVGYTFQGLLTFGQNHTELVRYGGVIIGRDGQIPDALRMSVVGTDGNDWKFVSGRVTLRAEGAGVPVGTPSPPEPEPSLPPTFTIFDDLSGPSSWLINGHLPKPAASGDCNWKAAATQFFVGQAWAEPWAPASMTIHAPSDAGFVNASNPALIVDAYWSDAMPAGPTDGTVFGTAAMTDGGGASATLTPPVEPHLCHWFVVSQNGAPQSMYCAQIVI